MRVNFQRFQGATIKLDIGTGQHNDILAGCATIQFAIGSIPDSFQICSVSFEFCAMPISQRYSMLRKFFLALPGISR